jgi:hypothetical protein
MSTEILNVATQYTVYNGYIILPLGIIGNIINILTFIHLKLFRGNRSAFCLTVEGISNLTYEFTSMSLTILTSIYGDDATGRSDIWCKIRYILGPATILIAYFMVCCTAIDQFFSTNYHVYLRQMCTFKLARCVAFTLTCLWIIHSIVFAMFFEAQPSVGCVILDRIALQYATFFFYPILTGCLPMAIASFFSLLAFRNVRQIVRRQIPIVRRRLDQQMTKMVLIRVVFFICLIFPYCFYRAYAISHPVSQSQPAEYAIAQLLQAIFLSFVRINSGVKLYLFQIHVCDVFFYCRSIFISL